MLRCVRANATADPTFPSTTPSCRPKLVPRPTPEAPHVTHNNTEAGITLAIQPGITAAIDIRPQQTVATPFQCC